MAAAYSGAGRRPISRTRSSPFPQLFATRVSGPSRASQSVYLLYALISPCFHSKCPPPLSVYEQKASYTQHVYYSLAFNVFNERLPRRVSPTRMDEFNESAEVKKCGPEIWNKGIKYQPLVRFFVAALN
jgi:hypothetical protein